MWEKPAFKETAVFTELLRNAWDVLNVKAPDQGKRRRDPLREPITKEHVLGIEFLMNFVEYLERWEELLKDGGQGFTKETFEATIQSCKAASQLAEYLLHDVGFIYVLTAMFQSDPIERRFGWYRQLSGGNYYINVRQIFEGEKKIRILNLVKFNKLSMPEIRAIFEADIIKVVAIITNWEPADLQRVPSVGENNALFYVAGYIAFSLNKKIKCDSCCTALKEGEETLEFEDPETQEEREKLSEYLDIVSRGGLSKPSNLLYLSCLFVHSLWGHMNNSDEEKDSLWTSSNPRATFVATFCEAMENSTDETANAVFTTKCEQGHQWSSILPRIAQVLCNVMCKNLRSATNDQTRAESKSKRKSDGKTLQERKTAKLQSETA